MTRCMRAMSVAVAVATLAAAPLLTSAIACADNTRLNNSVVSNVYTVQHQHGCTNDVHVNPQLRLAAQWHADDVLNNTSLDGDVGSDATSAQDRANAAGFRGVVTETVAINQSLAINNLDVISQWYYRPDYMAIMSNCANTQIGVWSANSFARSVVVAVYGHPA
jgi:hypothetical protein